MSFDFVNVFVRAAKITWKYKVLWVFGVFAGCSRNSGGGNSNSGGGNSNGDPSQFNNSPFTPEMERQLFLFAEKVFDWFSQHQWVIFAFIAVVLISIILQVFLGVVGTSGLIRGVVEVESGAESLKFGGLFSESLRYFWRIFWAGILIWLPAFLIFLLMILLSVVPLANSTDFNPFALAGVGILFVTVCCCIFPVSIALGFYNSMVNRAIVVDDLAIGESLKRGWQVLQKNILPILGVGIVVFLIGLIIGVIIILPIMIPSIFLIQAWLEGGFTSWQPLINIVILSLCYTPFLWFFNGVLTTYTETVWTLSYLGFTRPAKDNIPSVDPAPAENPAPA